DVGASGHRAETTSDLTEVGAPVPAGALLARRPRIPASAGLFLVVSARSHACRSGGGWQAPTVRAARARRGIRRRAAGRASGREAESAPRAAPAPGRASGAARTARRRPLGRARARVRDQDGADLCLAAPEGARA